MPFLFHLILSLCVTIFLFSSFAAQAGIVISNTRVIYNEDSREVTVKLKNKGDNPALVQSWIDDGDPKANPSTIHVPFTLSPPINRVDAEKEQNLRVFYTGEPLSETEESVFWLNVLEVPARSKSTSDENYLQMAFRTRIKLFFRPSGIEGEADTAADKLILSVEPNGKLRVTNPTPYHISPTAVSVTINNEKYNAEGLMVSPHSFRDFGFNNLNNIPSGSKVNITYINDYGAADIFESVIK